MKLFGRGSGFIRKLDFFIGIPLVWILSFFRRRIAAPSAVRRMGVLVSAAIGDTVVLSGVLRDIRAAYPDLEIVLFVGDSNKSIVPLLNCYSRFIVLPVKNPIRSIQMIRQEGSFDIWVDSGQWARINSVYSFFSRSRHRVGFQTPGQYRHFVFDQAVRHSNELHEIENYRNLFQSVGFQSTSLPTIEANSQFEPKRAVVHAFAGGSKPYLKEWPPSYWTQVIDHLTSLGFEVYLTGVSSDFEPAQKIKLSCHDRDHVQVVAGQLSLQETNALLKSSALVLSVNTGILHVAAALGCRVIGIHGPTSMKRWGPLGENTKGLQSRRPCSPCLNLGFDYGCNKNLCMQELRPRELIEEVDQVLQNFRRPS